ncbi:MAG: hypothetical protein ACK5KQ_02360 [Anaerorhabdus sp.]
MLIIIIAVFFALLIIIYTISRSVFVRKITYNLSVDKDISEYLSEINGLKGKILFSKDLRLILELDGYLVTKDIENCMRVYDKLKEMKFNFENKFKIESRIFMVYILARDELNASLKLLELKNMVSSQKNNAVFVSHIDEFECQLEIFLKRNGDFANVMIEKAKSSEGVKSGVYYYRAAICYFYKNDKENTDKNLVRAKELLIGTDLEKSIDKLIKADRQEFEKIIN